MKTAYLLSLVTEASAAECNEASERGKGFSGVLAMSRELAISLFAFFAAFSLSH
jgi:hypothetical protein